MDHSFTKRLRQVRWACAAALLLSGLAYDAGAQGLYTPGSQHLTVNLGPSNSLDKDYVGFGLGYRYFPLSGLGVGVDFDLLLGNSPLIYRVAPEIRYVFHGFERFIPYVGAMYQYHYIVDLDDKGGPGLRVGLFTPLSSRAYIGYGLSRGRLRQCDPEIYSECSTTQIEFSLAIRF